MIGPVIAAFFISLLFALLAGRWLIPQLTRLKFGQVVRDDGPSSHLGKKGTPTMGGLIFLVPTLVILSIGGVIMDLDPMLLGSLLVLIIGFGLVGLGDDALKVVFKRPLGLKARYKLAGQFLVMAFAGILLYVSGHDTSLSLPFSSLTLDAGILYWPFFALLVVGFGNGVNITDGVDGLAAGTVLIALSTYVVVGTVVKSMTVVFASAVMAAAVLGFLYYNRHPARVFMGDVGSLALGGALAGLSVISKTELHLLVFGAVFIFEAFSTTLQVIYFRITGGKRFFRMAPFHHHLELGGWTEQRVVKTFLLVAVLCGLIGLAGLWPQIAAVR
ncbi:MAG TPA: phospho-N-acetylmuramoyl-pentapeptide-transferase [Bacillota bacterium]|nr:phospho-N-acetylmuramoyl-pentapeptide-transferase [Bacillota bacterium]